MPSPASSLSVLVTGAAGFVGSHLAERLAALGHRVLGLDNFDEYYSPDLKAANARALEAVGVRMVRADLASDPLEEHLTGAEVVFHLAAQPGISATTPFHRYLRNNVVATQRLLEGIRGTGREAPFVVNVATSSVYGADASGPETAEPRPTSHYGVTKLAAEQLVLAEARERGLPACSLRLFSVYGPRERPDKLFSRLLGSLLEGRPFTLFEGSEEHERSYTYVGDAVEGLVRTLGVSDQLRGEIINLGNETSVRTIDAIRTAESVSGRTLRIERYPRRSGDQHRTHANIEKARRMLGYEPTTPLAEGIASHLAWYHKSMATEPHA